MKIKHLLLFTASALVLLSSCGQNMTGSSKMESELDSLSYMLGADVGKSIKGASFEEINYETFIQGIIDAFEEKDLQVNEEDIKPFIQKYITELRDKKMIINLEEGKAFLAENKTKEGIITTESGLQYEIITEGTGKSPVPTDFVKCHYHGTLIDGTVFDSSVDKGTPMDFGVSKVIPGWKEGLQLMKEGAKYKFYIPTELAYGQKIRPGGPIQPNMALIFEVELIEIKAPEQKEN
ncbi:MAG: FKBP-type peptidyl-prolyl cis-trans isomerase [Bacteroidales bacterium]|jgi:FKBP-type peptidyl-prolyl cis-trans isomerase|nr:FKBP-type peptidyl-prolyl cis-trans isomerase [Bacteroidales bacterium]